jgi:hypothetical protein
LLFSHNEATNSPVFYSRYQLPAFRPVSSRIGEFTERSRFEGDVKASAGNAEGSKTASKRQPDVVRHKEEARGNAVPSERRGSPTGAAGKTRKRKTAVRAEETTRSAGPVVLPDWTPATPEFKAAGAPARKIVEDEVRIVQTGTSSLTPEKIADSWQAAAAAANNLNQSLNKINVNGKITRILFLSTRTDPRQEVELEASREPDSKITQVEISSPLPKPDIESE